jgi:transcription elongation GreA/GreB family factor
MRAVYKRDRGDVLWYLCRTGDDVMEQETKPKRNHSDTAELVKGLKTLAKEFGELIDQGDYKAGKEKIAEYEAKIEAWKRHV